MLFDYMPRNGKHGRKRIVERIHVLLLAMDMCIAVTTDEYLGAVCLVPVCDKGADTIGGQLSGALGILIRTFHSTTSMKSLAVHTIPYTFFRL